MKYLFCQPDTHNAFGSLIDRRLTYFTVDRAELCGSSCDDVVINDPRGSMLIHVQSTLTLPADFSSAPLCFSLANRSLYGLDMAFVASRSGLAAVAVMASRHVLYAPERSPCALRDAMSTDRSASTVTWMRDKPLVFVGFLSGCVEWYHVTLSAARHQEATQSQSSLPAQSQQQQQQQQQYSAVEQTHDNGSGDGIRVRLCHSGRFPDAGAFLTSDWLPATGYVVAGAERAVYVFASEQPAAPLHCVPLAGSAALACHPFLPIVGCLSFGPATKDEASRDVCVCNVYEWAGGALRVAAAGEVIDKTAPARAGVYYSCSWKFSFDLCLAVSNVVEGRVHVMHFTHLDVDAGANGLPSLLATTRSLPLPLHALTNVEFISAATCTLRPLPASLSLSSSLVLGQSTTLAATGAHCATPTAPEKSVQLKENALAHQMLMPLGRHKNRSDRRSFLGSPTEDTRNKSRPVPPRSQLVLPGSGAVSCVVGINAAGEVAAVSADADATAAPLGASRVAVGLGATVFIANLATSARRPHVHVRGKKKKNEDMIQEDKNPAPEPELEPDEGTSDADDVNGDDVMAQRMRRRLLAGFGTSAEANVRALCTARGEADLRVLFAYIAILEHVGVIAAGDVVPSVIDLLSLPHAPSTSQLMDLKLLPRHAAVVCRSSTSQNDSRRLLLLHVLDWLPALQSDTPPSPPAFPHSQSHTHSQSHSHSHSHSQSYAQSHSESESQSHVPCRLSRDALERRVAVEVLHRRWGVAAALLRQNQNSDVVYQPLAALLQCNDGTATALRDAPAMVHDKFFAHLSPWLRLAFRFSQSPDTSEGRECIYSDAGLPLWDRVAVAVLLERDTPTLAARLRGDFARECSLVQRLLLDGISAASWPLMQRIVDCTADFQLAACLFARIGASAPAEREECHAMVNKAAEAWEMWAAAYRAFLNDEQEFVKRTTFDLACQQLAGAQRGGMTSKPKPSPELAPELDPEEWKAQTLASLLVGHRHCSVCAARVAVQQQCARDSFAWCSACLHGGHANHLQEWFARHRKCPVDICNCRCDQSGSML